MPKWCFISRNHSDKIRFGIDQRTTGMPAFDVVRLKDDLLVLRLRSKLPDAGESTRVDVPLADRAIAFQRADPDVRFAAGVRTLLESADIVLLEVGPGRTLGTLVPRGGAHARTRIAPRRRIAPESTRHRGA